MSSRRLLSVAPVSAAICADFKKNVYAQIVPQRQSSCSKSPLRATNVGELRCGAHAIDVVLLGSFKVCVTYFGTSSPGRVGHWYTAGLSDAARCTHRPARVLLVIIVVFRVAGYGDRLHHRGEGGASDSPYANMGIGKPKHACLTPPNAGSLDWDICMCL